MYYDVKDKKILRFSNTLVSKLINYHFTPASSKITEITVLD